MRASKIPIEDWNVIKKYSMKDIQKQLLIEESVLKPNKDYFSKLLILIDIIFIIITYIFNDVKYYSFFIFLFPFFIASSHSILGYHYGKKSQFQVFTLILSLSIFLLAEYIITYYNLRSINQSINPAIFIFFSFYGILGGIMIGIFLREIVSKDIIIGNPDNLNIEVLSHTEKLESYEDILKNLMNNVIDLRNFPAYNGETEKIYQEVGFKNIYLLYTIVDNSFAFLVFSKNGRYIIQDEKSIEIQKKISFLLINALAFKNSDDGKIKNNAIDSCLILLKQYVEPNTIRVFIETHKTPTFLLILLGVLAIFYPLYSQYMDKLLKYMIDSIIPVVFSAIIIFILESYRRKNK